MINLGTGAVNTLLGVLADNFSNAMFQRAFYSRLHCVYLGQQSELHGQQSRQQRASDKSAFCYH
jgi:hypothetical protein